MAYDEKLAMRIREVLDALDETDVLERKMFGGLAFMVRGNMAVGIVGFDLMVRVGPDGQQPALERPHARPMDFTGRPLTGFVYVAPAGFKTRAALTGWVTTAIDFVRAQPAGANKKRRSRPPRFPQGKR